MDRAIFSTIFTVGIYLFAFGAVSMFCGFGLLYWTAFRSPQREVMVASARSGDYLAVSPTANYLIRVGGAGGVCLACLLMMVSLSLLTRAKRLKPAPEANGGGAAVQSGGPGR